MRRRSYQCIVINEPEIDRRTIVDNFDVGALQVTVRHAQRVQPLSHYQEARSQKRQSRFVCRIIPNKFLETLPPDPLHAKQGPFPITGGDAILNIREFDEILRTSRVKERLHTLVVAPHIADVTHPTLNRKYLASILEDINDSDSTGVHLYRSILPHARLGRLQSWVMDHLPGIQNGRCIGRAVREIHGDNLETAIELLREAGCLSL